MTIELSESEMISYTMQAIYDTFHLLKNYLYINVIGEKYVAK